MATKVKSAAKKVIPAKKTSKKAGKKKKDGKNSKGKRRKGRRGGGLVLLVLMTGVLAAVVFGVKNLKSAAENLVEVRPSAVMGATGKGPGQLQSPRGIAASGGLVAVTDLGNSRVNVYEESGEFKFSFGTPGDEGGPNPGGTFREPSGVAISPDGEYFVADAWNGRIQRFDSEGKFLQEYKGAPYNFYSPRNVAVDKRGNIYVADTGNSQIKTFTTAGGKPKLVGDRGKGGGQFQEVFGIAINSKGEVFGADPGNRRVHKFGPIPGAQHMTTVDIPGWKAGSPFWPHIAIDAQDRVFVADNVNQKIWVYDSELNYLATLGGQAGQNPFGSPLGLAISSRGEVLVSDMNGNRVLKLSLPDLNTKK